MGVRRLYKAYVDAGHSDIPRGLVEGVLERPCSMWVGLFDPSLFDTGMKLRTTHELFQIVTMASVLSWGRFYPVP